MANPYIGEVRPYGWRPVSNELPAAVANVSQTRGLAEAEVKSRFDFTRGPVFRGDAPSNMLRVAPLMRRMARFNTPTYRGEVTEAADNAKPKR